MLREGEVLGVFTPEDPVCYGYPCGGCPNCLKLQTLDAREYHFDSEQEANALVRVYTRDARMREKLNRGWGQSRQAQAAISTSKGRSVP